MKKITIILFAALSIFSACEDDTDDKTKRDLLCQDDWKLNAWTATIVYSGSTQIFDLFNNPEENGIQVCILDDEVEFDTDGDFSTKPGPLSCNRSLMGNGEWGFMSEETILSMTEYGLTSSRDYTIETLTEDNCILTIIEPAIVNNDTVDATMKMTFIH